MNRAAVVTMGMLFACGLVSQGADGMWAVNSDGLWTDSLNWTNGAVAGGVGAYAYFTNSSVDLTVTVPAEGVTVGRMEFRSGAGNNNWTFRGGPLLLDGPNRKMSLVKGTQKFYAPFVAANGFQKEPTGTGGTLSFYRTMTSTGRIDQLTGSIISSPELVWCVRSPLAYEKPQIQSKIE